MSPGFACRSAKRGGFIMHLLARGLRLWLRTLLTVALLEVVRMHCQVLRTEASPFSGFYRFPNGGSSAGISRRCPGVRRRSRQRAVGGAPRFRLPPCDVLEPVRSNPFRQLKLRVRTRRVHELVTRGDLIEDSCVGLRMDSTQYRWLPVELPLPVCFKRNRMLQVVKRWRLR